jgi:hypothetical protein
MAKDYIRDDGRIRMCDSNLAKMNIFEGIYYNSKVYYEYMCELPGVTKDALWYTFIFINNFMILISFPITLPIFAYFRIRNAKKEVQKNNNSLISR